MHDEHLAAALGHGADEIAHKAVGLDAVDADAVLHRDRQRAAQRVVHGLHAIAHQGRLGHQAGAERAALHPLAGAAAVQVHLVIAPLLRQPGTGRQIGRLAAAQLQRQRMLLGVEVEVAVLVAVQQRAGGHHLGVEPGVARDQPVEIAAVAVGPVEHRRDRQAPGAGGHGGQGGGSRQIQGQAAKHTAAGSPARREKRWRTRPWPADQRTARSAAACAAAARASASRPWARCSSASSSNT